MFLSQFPSFMFVAVNGKQLLRALDLINLHFYFILFWGSKAETGHFFLRNKLRNVLYNLLCC